MALDLNNYFQLGLTSQNDPLENTAIHNTIRVAPDTTSSLHNKVTFKVQNQGMLTKDSGIMIQAVGGSAVGGNVAINALNGILGSINRCQILIDGQELTNLEKPAYYEAAKMYSKNNTVQLREYNKSLIGNDFKTEISKEDINNEADYGKVVYDDKGSNIYNDTHNNFIPKREYITSTAADCKKYFVHLHELGANFLKHDMLPLFLLKDRDIQIHLEFEPDCTKWAFNVAAAGDVQIQLDATELIQTIVLPDQELMQQSIDQLQEQSAQFPLIETYRIASALNLAGTNKNVQTPVLLNVQNRELHKVCIAVEANPYVNNGLYDNVLGNQGSMSFGNLEYNIRSNGVYLFDNDIKDPSLQYYLCAEANNGQGFQINNDTFCRTALKVAQQAVVNSTGYEDLRELQHLGRMCYVEQTFRNGNTGVYSAGTHMKTPLEFNLTTQAVTSTHPNQQQGNTDIHYFVSVSKLLTIMPNGITITF